jgi:hypothetical protein
MLFGQAVRVHRRLPLDPGQRRALRLGLDDADDLLVHIQEVVGAAVAGRHDRLAHRDAWTSEQVEVAPVDDEPARPRELPVDLDPSPRLGRQVVAAHLVPSCRLTR